MDTYANFAYSTVATAPSPATSGTTIVIASGDGAKFPAVPFNAVVWPAGASPLSSNAEIVRVTARSTDTLTVTRTQEGTSARTIVAGDQIMQAVTAKTLTDVLAGSYVYVRHDPASGIALGNVVTGAWQVRSLTTEVTDSDNLESLASNQIVLSAGTYRAKGFAVGYATGRFKCRLRNVTDSTTLLVGSNDFSSDDCTHSHMVGNFTVGASKTLQVESWSEAGHGTFGFGVPASSGEVEIYVSLELWKIG